MELIGAKLPLAGDLCPLCPPTHYLVTNITKAPLPETTRDDETAAEAG